jgi:hypothetical protein
MLFLPNEYGAFFAGWYPHVLVLLALAFALRVRTAGKWLLYCVLQLLCLSSVPSRYENGQWVLLVTHIFRYLCFVSIPLCLALAAYLRELVRWRPVPGLAVTALLLGWSVVQSVELSWPTRDAFGEQRRANALILSTFPDEIVWSDFGFSGRLMSFAPDRRGITRLKEIRAENPVGQARELRTITDGVVVTGGGRLPWYGCIWCALSIAAFVPPPAWTLVTMYGAAEIGPHRLEPMRIWRVSPAVARADQLLTDRLDEPSRVALLHELVLGGENELAAEVGRRLLEQRLQPAGTIAYLTGLACSRSGKAATARLYWERALGGILSPAEARQIILATIASGTPDDIDVVHAWIARFRVRFPGERLDPAMEAVPVGFAEVRSLVRDSRFAEAAARLRAIRDDERETPERRQRAHYFAARALFSAHAVDEGTREAATYRARYGDDALATELRYREGEVRLVLDRNGARRAFSDVVVQAPQSLWATQARTRLAQLDAAAPAK